MQGPITKGRWSAIQRKLIAGNPTGEEKAYRMISASNKAE